MNAPIPPETTSTTLPASNMFLSATDVCSENISRHGRLALVVFAVLAVLLLAIVVFASVYAKSEGGTRDSERFQRMLELRDAQASLTKAREKSDQSKMIIERIQKDEKMAQTILAAPANPMSDEAKFILEELGRTNILFDEYFGQGQKAGPQTVEDLKVHLEKVTVPHLKEREANERKVSASEAKTTEVIEAQTKALEAQLRNYKPPALISPELMAGLIALITIVVSVFTSLYRFHLREITKNEQYKVAFLRLNIASTVAGENSGSTDLTKTLTENAFTVQQEGSTIFSRRVRSNESPTTMRVESPLPGHPTSELATGIVNKLLEQIEIVLQPKPKPDASR